MNVKVVKDKRRAAKTWRLKRINMTRKVEEKACVMDMSSEGNDSVIPH